MAPNMTECQSCKFLTRQCLHYDATQNTLSGVNMLNIIIFIQEVGNNDNAEFTKMFHQILQKCGFPISLIE
jgi:hypothetical protein